jgi:hypothetical protein|tara:strand:- start:666 stop:896 length:231 start_codon:yes stop_codon:yes gene_type:complete
MDIKIFNECEHSEDENKLCPFARNTLEENEFVNRCDLIYPIYAKNSDTSNLKKCFNLMLPREKHAFSRKMEKLENK